MLMSKEHILTVATKLSFEASMIGVPYVNYVWMALVLHDWTKEEIENRKNPAM